MQQQINYGLILGIPAYSIFVESTIMKVEKEVYTTTNSTTTTEYKTDYEYYRILNNTTVTTNTNTTPHHITRLFLDDGRVFEYKYNLNVMEGWHVRQHFLNLNNSENLLFTFIPESGKYIGNNWNVEDVFKNIYPLRQANFSADHTNYKLSMWFSLPCLFYLLHFAFPKYFDFELTWLIKGCVLGVWTILTLICTVWEIIQNLRYRSEGYDRFLIESSNANLQNQQMIMEINPIINQSFMLDQEFRNNGLQNIIY